MTKKILIATIVVFGGISWWFYQSNVAGQTAQEQNQPSETIGVSTSSKNVYRNEEWGFQFEYPEGWELLENTFKAASSKFNLVLDVKTEKGLPRPIFINVTDYNWGVKVLESMTNEDFEISEVVVGGKVAKKHRSDDMGLPLDSYFVLINNEYWINIAGKDGYEKEFNLVLESFEFLE